MSRPIPHQADISVVAELAESRFQRRIPRANRNSLVAVFLPHSQCLLTKQMPATDVERFPVLSQRTHVVGQCSPVVYIKRMEAEHREKFFRRQALALVILKTVGTTTIELAASNQISEPV